MSMRKVWPNTKREQLTPFDAMLANKFRGVFPGLISREEFLLCESFAFFVEGIFRTIRDDIDSQIATIAEEFQFFLQNAIKYVR